MFDEDKSIEGCPYKFRSNCANYGVQCYCCLANDEVEGDNFYYDPLLNKEGLQRSNHPYKAKVKQEYKDKAKLIKEEKNTDKAKVSRTYNRKGKEIERKVIKSIEGANTTYTSGSTSGDGDGWIILQETKFRLGHKNRFSAKNQLGPTKDEWIKGKREGCDIWLTSSKEYGTIVTMPKLILDELISLIKLNDNKYK